MTDFAWTASSGYKSYPPYINLTGDALTLRGEETFDPDMGHPVVGPQVSVKLPPEAIQGLRAALAALPPSHSGEVETLRVPRALLEELAPEEPINQDEQGGCVWCGSSSRMWRRKTGNDYAGKDPREHFSDCPWVEARAALRNSTDGETK